MNTYHDYVCKLISYPTLANVIDIWEHNCYVEPEDAHVSTFKFIKNFQIIFGNILFEGYIHSAFIAYT